MADLLPQLERATRGDRQALRRVVEHWWPQMRRWALCECGDPTLAEDAVQEALIRLMRFIGRYDTSRPFAPWLRSLVRNSCRDQLRARGTVADRPETSEASHRPRVGRQVDLDRAAEGVIAAFASLPPRQREIVDRVDLQGMSPAEVAQELGLSGGAVRAQLFQARRTLRSTLTRRGEVLELLREA